ncbi:MAG: prepilin-type N-terminal cleavage/methylation domain-containing protein [Desulfobacterales bacterium]|nr:prepilin-type N-terminal cleavage/methylation domain-containing protein [Desulfobacterales bacterium]
MLVESDKANKEKGFTLLEVLIAISIFSIGILAVGTMQISSIRGNASARTHTEAATWAADRVERLMALPYNHPDLQDTDGDGAAGLNDATEATDDNPNPPPREGVYTIFWNVADNTPITNTKTITVIVTWNARGANRSVSMQHVIPQIL